MGQINKIRYLALGDTDRIGASCHYIRLGEWGIMLDAGLDPAENATPDFDCIKNEPVNAIIVSHAHLDHLGALPLAVRYFPHARIYMTPATAALSEILLFHYLNVQKKQAAENWEKQQLFFTEEEVEQIIYLFQSFKYNFPFKLHGFLESNIEITFWDAGHILGSAGIEINYQGSKIFYSGNTKKSSQFILKGGKYPVRTDFLLCESTYGDNEIAPTIKKKTEMNNFAEFLKNSLNIGGSVLIPVFALGRTQEILVLLHQLIQKNKIPSVPIYITGLGNKINRIYDRLLHKTYPEFTFKRLGSITYALPWQKKFKKPAIILATSGMMIRNTVSYEIARDFLDERRNSIAFVGWADPETPGGSLREGKLEKIKHIFGVETPKCKIDVFYFSAHSHREEIMSLVKAIRAKKIIFCHGEKKALQWMSEEVLRKNIESEVIIPKKCEAVILNNREII